MHALILGAGRGTRLSALGLDAPKILVPVAGEPLLARQLRHLAVQGVEHVVVTAFHRADQVVAFARAHAGPPALEVIVEDQLLGTAGGVRNALRALPDEPFVVLYGDVLAAEAVVAPLRATHDARGAGATIAVYASTQTEGKGTVDLDGADRILAFREKQDADGGPAWVNAGIYVLDPPFVRALVPAGASGDFGHDVFPAALAAGRPIAAHRLARPVLDVGTPADLARAQQRLGGDQEKYPRTGGIRPA